MDIIWDGPIVDRSIAIFVILEIQDLERRQTSVLFKVGDVGFRCVFFPVGFLSREVLSEWGYIK